MNYREYASKMKEIQSILLYFIEKDDDYEENYQNLTGILESYNIQKEKHMLKLVLYLILQISKNHYRSPNFFSKIIQVLLYLKEEIIKNFTNFEIFKIFKSSKNLLLTLIEEKIITIDQSIYREMTTIKCCNNKYDIFFYPELKTFIEEERETKNEVEEIIRERTKRFLPKIMTNEHPVDFEEKRKFGENDNKICELIRNDSIEEFIIYLNKSNLSLTSTIEPSIFETNSLLTKNKVLVTDCFRQSFDVDYNLTLIEYAAFFGSIQIFNYLYKNGVQLSPSLWIYAIHSDNSEMIHILEENNIEPGIECLKESIKSNHNDITNYLQKKYFENINFSKDSKIFEYCFHYYNFAYFPDDLINEWCFTFACQFDYFLIVEFFLNMKKIDLKELSVLFISF